MEVRNMTENKEVPAVAVGRRVIKKAMTYAVAAHLEQVDDGDNDYFLHHCYPVYEIIRILCPLDYALQAAAFLHDTVEDTPVTYEDLVREFGVEVADLVNEVTHERRKDDKGWYFPRLKSIRGVVLKFADRSSNLSRMEGVWNENRIKKYITKSTFWETEDFSDVDLDD